VSLLERHQQDLFRHFIKISLGILHSESASITTSTYLHYYLHYLLHIRACIKLHSKSATIDIKDDNNITSNYQELIDKQASQKITCVCEQKQALS